MAGIFRVALGTYPSATLVAIGLFALYAVPFWIFVGGLDYLEGEPPLLRAMAFAWGGLVATTTAISGNTAAHNLVAKLVSPGFAAAWGSALAGPTNEEILKTLGVVAIVLIAGAQVNSVLDGVVYGALVGLGFQVIEDIVYAVNAVALAGNGDRVGPVIATFFGRGFLAGLWSHTLFSALAGAGMAYVVVRTDRPLWTRLLVAAGALAGAWLCHFVWNSPVLPDDVGYVGVFAGLLLKGIPPLLLVLWVVRCARAREADHYAAHLGALGDPAVATEGELRALRSGRLRAAARRYAYSRAGLRGRAAVRGLQRAQARLAVELSRAGLGHAAAAYRYREVLLARQRLWALGHPDALAPAQRGRAWRQRLAGPGTAVLVLVAVALAIRALVGG
jgi:RsiW-degrading membrane proteinase PrsW (M82 family)